jgi:hypothetical protein
MNLTQAENRRDVGINRAVNRADRDNPQWSEDAMHALEMYCKAHPDAQFLGEQVRAWGEGLELVEPPADGRAWGAVFRRAASLGIIRRVGYAPAMSSNLAPKCLWGAV